MLVALLAVLKAGCAYVPLEPAHPEARLHHILEDAGVAALITDGSGRRRTAAGRQACRCTSTPSDAPSQRWPAIPGGTLLVTREADLAYVIYTSGSTGLPKGVEVTHRAVVNFLSSMAREPGLSAHDVLLAVTTVSFDIAGLELYLPLLVGARVVIAAREVSTDGFALRAQLERCAVTAMQATPATWRLLLEAGFRAPAGFKMLCGGEALPRELADAPAAGRRRAVEHVWPHRDHDLVLLRARGGCHGADQRRAADRQYAVLRPRCPRSAAAAGRARGAAHRWRGRGARLS